MKPGGAICGSSMTAPAGRRAAIASAMASGGIIAERASRSGSELA